MPFYIVREDITRMRVDAVVNAANPFLQMGGGVCGAIFRAAGEEKMRRACEGIGGCETGRAVITPGFKLPAKYVIHTPGPRWEGGKAGEEPLLRASYQSALRLAAEYGCRSVAFPLISSGIYGYPKAEALWVAAGAVRDFLRDEDMDVYLAVLDREEVDTDGRLMGAVDAYVGRHYAGERAEAFRRFEDTDCFVPCVGAPQRNGDECMAKMAAPSAAPAFAPDDPFDRLDEPFSRSLLKLIDQKGKTDAEVYKRANIDRRLFSKIRTKPGYMPGKRTVLALAVALELNLTETRSLLERAGFALSRSQKLDVIVEFFIENRRYDIFEINEVLFRYDQPLLGS